MTYCPRCFASSCLSRICACAKAAQCPQSQPQTATSSQINNYIQCFWPWVQLTSLSKQVIRCGFQRITCHCPFRHVELQRSEGRPTALRAAYMCEGGMHQCQTRSLPARDVVTANEPPVATQRLHAKENPRLSTVLHGRQYIILKQLPRSLTKSARNNNDHLCRHTYHHTPCFTRAVLGPPIPFPTAHPQPTMRPALSRH